MGFENATLGTGVFTINARPLGLTKGNITATRGVELKDCEGGVPLQIQGRVPIRERHEITIPLLELTVENLSDLALNVPQTIISGGAQAVLDGADQERTFASFGGNGLEYIRLDGPALTTVVLKDITEVTTYVENTDYFVDPTSDLVYRLPLGAIPAGSTVRVHYGYTAVASERLNFGNNLPLTEKEVIFTHLSPVSGDTIVVFMPRAQFAGELVLNFETEEFAVVNGNAVALPSPLHPLAPLGYWERIPAP